MPGAMIARAQKLFDSKNPAAAKIELPPMRLIISSEDLFQTVSGSFRYLFVEAHKARPRAANQERNSPDLWAVRLIPGLLCA